MTFIWTPPDPLDNKAKTRSIYMTELQAAANVKRVEIAQSQLSFINQNIGKNFVLGAVEELKTVVNQLAIDFGYPTGVEDPALLGRPYVTITKKYGKSVCHYPILNDLRMVLNTIIVRAPILMLAEDTKWGNYTEYNIDEGISLVNIFFVGDGVSPGKVTMSNNSRYIMEVKNKLSPLGLASYSISRLTGEKDTQLQTGITPVVQDICVDDTFIYYLDNQVDGSINIIRYYKDERTIPESTLNIQGPVIDIPYYSLNTIICDESKIYLLGEKYIDYVAEYPPTWHGPSIPPNDRYITLGVVISIDKTSFGSFSETTFNIVYGDLSSKINEEAMTNIDFSGGALDSDYIYSFYHTQAGWRRLVDDPEPWTYYGSSEPPHPSPGDIWVCTGHGEEFVGKYESLVLVRGDGNWFSHPNQSLWLAEGFLFSRNIVKINKSSGVVTRLDADITYDTGGGGFAVENNYLYYRYSNKIRIFNKFSGTYINEVTASTFGGSISSNQAYEITNPEKIIPYSDEFTPTKGQKNVAKNTNVVLHIKDDNSGVDKTSIEMIIFGQSVPLVIVGTRSDYTLTYNPTHDFNPGQVIEVNVKADDLAGNSFSETYSFQIAT